jgi:hypothetical protein
MVNFVVKTNFINPRDVIVSRVDEETVNIEAKKEPRAKTHTPNHRDQSAADIGISGQSILVAVRPARAHRGRTDDR